MRAIAGAAAAAAPAEAEQLDLLPFVPTRFEPGTQQHTEFVERVRRAGRPIGAKNLAQQRVVELVRRLFGDPLVERARWLLHSPQTLAAELECSKLEAFELQDKIRADMMRYCYAPLAATDAQGKPVAPVFQMVMGGAGSAGPGAPPWVYDGGPELEAHRARNAAKSATCRAARGRVARRACRTGRTSD